MDELYPSHAKALRDAKLVTGDFPTLGEVLDDESSQITEPNDKKSTKNQDKRIIRFCIGMCKCWSKPIHAILKELREKHGLSWLRFTMSYHKFSNFREILQGDMNRKLMEGIISRDFMDLPCNCNNATKRSGKCIYSESCRKSVVVYKVTCTKGDCEMFYIGNTQQKL